MAIAGVDVGTTGSKCTIFHDEGGVSAYSYREYALERGAYGYMELSGDRVWDAVRTVIAEATAAHRGDPVGRCALPPAARWACRWTGRAMCSTAACFIPIPEARSSAGRSSTGWAATRS
jgi:hypothetical protein